MIVRFFIWSMKVDWALTKTELTTRFVALLLLLGIIFFLLVLTLWAFWKKQIRIIPALLLAAALIFDAAGAIPFLQGEKQIPLEYVGSIESARNGSIDRSVEWYTDYSAGYPEPVKKEKLEKDLKCDLTGFDLGNSKYTYLFVYNYKDVELFYSKWSETIGYTGNPDGSQVITVGRLEPSGKATENTVYIFRFPRQPIVPNCVQFLY